MINNVSILLNFENCQMLESLIKNYELNGQCYEEL